MCILAKKILILSLLSLAIFAGSAQANLARVTCVDENGKLRFRPNEYHFLFEQIKIRSDGSFRLKAHRVMARRLCTPDSFPVQLYPCVVTLDEKPQEYECGPESNISHMSSAYLRYRFDKFQASDKPAMPDDSMPLNHIK